MDTDYLTKLSRLDSDLMPIPHAPCEWELPAWDDDNKEGFSHPHLNHLWVDGCYPFVGCVVVATHPMDMAFPAPSGTLSRAQYVSRMEDRANIPAPLSVDSSALARCLTARAYATPVFCPECGDMHAIV